MLQFNGANQANPAGIAEIESFSVSGMGAAKKEIRAASNRNSFLHFAANRCGSRNVLDGFGKPRFKRYRTVCVRAPVTRFLFSNKHLHYIRAILAKIESRLAKASSLVVTCRCFIIPRRSDNAMERAPIYRRGALTPACHTRFATRPTTLHAKFPDRSALQQATLSDGTAVHHSFHPRAGEECQFASETVRVRCHRPALWFAGSGNQM